MHDMIANRTKLALCAEADVVNLKVEERARKPNNKTANSVFLLYSEFMKYVESTDVKHLILSGTWVLKLGSVELGGYVKDISGFRSTLEKPLGFSKARKFENPCSSRCSIQ